MSQFDEAVYPSDDLSLPVARSEEFSAEEIRGIAERFALDAVERIELFRERGNINLSTYVVAGWCNDQAGEFLLQRINTVVFAKPYRLMRAMVRYTEAQRAYLDEHAHENIDWDPVRLVPSRKGAPFVDVHDAYGWSMWRMMYRIRGCVAYKSLEDAPAHERLALARAVGEGLGVHARVTSRMDLTGLLPSLPGYRDTRGYLRQFEAVLTGGNGPDEVEAWFPDDPELRQATAHLYHLTSPEAIARAQEPALKPYLDLIRTHAGWATLLVDRVEDGSIGRSVIHGDTKIENFLFDLRTRRVRALVDLDTIMPFTWLADWGDMIRSLVNVAGEKEPDLDRIQVNQEIYRAVATGFLGAVGTLPPSERELMPQAVEVIAFELGTRFLTDYLRGDNYFRLTPNDPPDLNRTRGMVQLTLFERLRELRSWAEAMLAEAMASGAA